MQQHPSSLSASIAWCDHERGDPPPPPLPPISAALDATQAIDKVAYKKIDIEWACRDSDFEKKAWTHTQSPPEGFEDIEGDQELDFTVSVTVPSKVTAGIRCVALVVADEVSMIGVA